MPSKSLMSNTRRSLLSKQQSLQAELDSMGNPPEGGWSLKDSKRRKQINKELDDIGQRLADLPDPEKRFP